MSEPLTLGVEEEFQVVDRRTLELTSGYTRLMQRATPAIAERLKKEYYRCVVECVTPVCADIAAARQEAATQRATAIALARRSGLAILSAGTHPRSRWEVQQRSDDDQGRYATLEDLLQDVARSITIFGLHVHVGIADPAARLAVLNQARGFLPYILALSVNSPFWRGRRTGFHSFRTVVWAPFPMANMPEAFASLEEYEAFLGVMERADALSENRRLWWDIRPHHTLPTLEFRIADMPANLEDTLAIVAYIQALCQTILERTERGEPLPVAPTLVINENKWRAARYGLRGTMIDCTREPELARQQPTPTVQLIRETLDLIGPAAEALGALRELSHLHQMVSDGFQTGAEKQLIAFERRFSLDDVLKCIEGETRAGISPPDALPLARRSILRRFKRGDDAA
jgi:glutamate---cysteine ligase / carboxylate-amine ligase